MLCANDGASLAGEIRARLDPPCRVISEAGSVIPDRTDAYYVADLAVTCVPREAGRRMSVEPVLIVEVLSPATSQLDRWRKVADYRRLPSVQEVLVAFSEKRRVDLQRRGRRRLTGQGSDRSGSATAVQGRSRSRPCTRRSAAGDLS